VAQVYTLIRSKKEYAMKHEDERISTGIQGLDAILNGGLPSNRCYILRGGPGTGKTTIGMQFLEEGIRRGETVVFIT
jgi:circadian clock protein KaiC